MSFKQPSDDFLDMLMSGKGQQYLDREIEKLRMEIGEEEFQEFAEEYFRKEGEDNVYATKKDKGKEKEMSNEVKSIQQQKGKQAEQQAFLVTEVKDEKQYLEQSPKITAPQPEPQEQEQQQQIIEQGTTNNEEQGLTQISREVLPSGLTKIIYNNGDTYQGQCVDLKKQGWGTYSYSNGQKYTGLFDEDEIHGYGRYYFLSGAEYQGDWSSGMKHGIGILKFANGDVYEGSFVKDELHGNGIFRYGNGDVFEGRWKGGKRDGKGKFVGVDGLVRIGDWVDDKFTI